jgi:ribonuclease-3
MTTIEDIKKSFKDSKLFDHALTHRSWVNEHKGVRTSNERLEFLGDAILEFVVSREIFNLFPDKEEGFLTALRANLVNTVALSEFAKKINIGSVIFLSKGEEESGGRTNTSLLADTIEALIGATFIDNGLESAESFIKQNLLLNLKEKASQPLKDAKSQLQEYVQSLGLTSPKYIVRSESGPDHDKEFTIDVTVDGEIWGTGIGKSKSSAEQSSASKAISSKITSEGH